MPSRDHPLKFWNAILLGIASGLIVLIVFILALIGAYHHVHGNLAERAWAVEMAISTFKWGGLGLLVAEAVLLMASATVSFWHAFKRR